MATVTGTTETANATIKITLTRNVTDKVAYADGYDIVTGREIYERYEVVITSKANGQSIRTSGMPGGFAFFTPITSSKGLPAGAVARVGDAFVGQNTYNAAMTLIAELDAQLPKSDEQKALEAAEAERKAKGEANMARMAAEQRKREAHPGWCKRCQDYTYGDCGHK